MDLKELKVRHVSWIHLAKDRIKYRVLEKMVINLLVLHKDRLTLIS
jgi:hypothetical protein